MRSIIVNGSLFSDAVKAVATFDNFCVILDCSLIRLHEGSSLFTLVRGEGGKPIKVYIADSSQTVEINRNDDESEWFEFISKNPGDIYACKEENGRIDKKRVVSGVYTPLIDKSFADDMKRMSTDENGISVISSVKYYNDEEQASLQKRSIIDLSSVNSRGVDIIYFEGADKLIEKLLYGGCRELSVFLKDVSKENEIKKKLKKISKRAPFTNTIYLITDENYSPKERCRLLVGAKKDVMGTDVPRVFLDNVLEGGKTVSYVGQNSTSLEGEGGKLNSCALHYVTSLMSELVLNAVSNGAFSIKRLYKVNAKTLHSENILTEE